MGTNRAGANQTNQKRPAFTRHPLRCTLALIAEGWLRLEQRWEDNPGFVAMTAAGSLGLLLTAAMLFNSGLSWLKDDTPAGDDVAVESPDEDGNSGNADAAKANDAQSDLGDASDDKIFFVKGRKPNKKAFEDTDDADDDSDPFAESKAPARPIVSRIDEDVMDDADDNAAEETVPVQIAKTKTSPLSKNPFDDDANDETMETAAEPSTPEPEEEPVEAPAKTIAALPVEKPDSLDDDEPPAETDEPEVKRPLPEMRVATRPEVSQSLDTEDEEETTASGQLAEQESKPVLKEPARLKQIEADEPLDNESSKPERSINLVQVPAEKPAPRDDDRWKQQQTKVIPENAAPAVAARQSRPVETRIFAAPKSSPVSPSPVPPSPIPSDPVPSPVVQASSVPVVKERRSSRDSSAVPQLRLAISGPPAVGLGQPCLVEIQVTNTSTVTARHLVVSAELPEGLVHDVAQSLEQQIESLAPGATYRALLRLRGEVLGDKTIEAEVESADQSTLQRSAKVRVTPASATSTTIGTADCYCAPLMR
jgi:hypothetical protein